MRISILGCGRWGAFLAWYLSGLGNDVLLWGRETSEKLKQLKATRKNDYVSLPDSVKFSCSISETIDFSDYIIISIEGHHLREFMKQIVKEKYNGKTFILCMKGLEPDTGLRFSEVATEYLGNAATIAVWIGPGQPRDIFNGNATCMIISSIDFSVKKYLAEVFSSKLIKIFLGSDMIGNEIGAAAKNVIGIAGGMLDGLKMEGLKGILMTKGTFEISQLIRAMGGDPFTAYGLCCFGDYGASLFSKESNSRNFGISFIEKRDFNKYAPGRDTAKPVSILAKKSGIKMPIMDTVYQILMGEAVPDDLRKVLMPEGMAFEFDERFERVKSYG